MGMGEQKKGGCIDINLEKKMKERERGGGRWNRARMGEEDKDGIYRGDGMKEKGSERGKSGLHKFE